MYNVQCTAVNTNKTICIENKLNSCHTEQRTHKLAVWYLKISNLDETRTAKKNACKLTAKEREWEKLGNTVIGHSAVIPCNIFSNTFSLSSKRHSYLRRDDVYEFSKKRTQKKHKTLLRQFVSTPVSEIYHPSVSHTCIP